MGIAFDRDGQADFMGMVESAGAGPGLYISDAIHQAVMDVDEKGTRAAAATAVGMTLRSARVEQPFDMVVDRPFYCSILELPMPGATPLPLFMGYMNAL